MLTLRTLRICFYTNSHSIKILLCRGGAEDTTLEAKTKDTKTSEAKDRNARGQGPRKQTQVFSEKRRSSKIFFWRSPQKKRSRKNFLADVQNFNHSKNSAVLEPRTRNFRGLSLRGQGQGLQNVFSRTYSRPRTSSRTPPLLL